MILEENRIYIGGGHHLYKRIGDDYFERRYDWTGECYPSAWRLTTYGDVKATEWQHSVKLEILTVANMSPGMYIENNKIKMWLRAKDDEY